VKTLSVPLPFVSTSLPIMEDANTPSSALSDINSDEVESIKFNRSRSNSRESTLSALSNDSASAAGASPRHLEMPPAKRRKTGTSAYDHATPQSVSTAVPPRSPSGSISSDTSGSVPTSPSFAYLGPTHPLSTAYAAAQANPENPELADYIQVTRCLWEDCPNPEQGNMDNLVQHLNNVHIVARQKKFYCQWQGCGRKGQPHTSAYALKAHMRSHTKEKPFYCVLPECDRSFTRSDALAKHMRTVHETEALRPSDPVPRGHTGGISNGSISNGTKTRIKLLVSGGPNGEKRPSIIGELPPLPTKYTVANLGIKTEEMKLDSSDESEELADAVDLDSVPVTIPLAADYYPADVWEDMDEYERSLPPSQYFRLLRRQITWAEEDDSRLLKEVAELRSTAEDMHGNLLKKGAGDERGADDNRKYEWQQTERILDALLQEEVGQVSEMFTGERRVGNDTSPWQMIKNLDTLVQTSE
jgi:Zinc finger, C2H2 type